MKDLKYFFITIIVFTIMSSCNKFETINTDPNSPATVTPDLLATQVLQNTFTFWNPNPTDFGTGNLWAKHITNLETNPNPYQYYYSYYPYGSFGGFQNLTNLKRMVEFAKGEPTQSSFDGLALFLKAYDGFGMTMDMGDIPYSEAGMAEEGNTTPKYDKQSDVFTEILADLDSAEAKFAEGSNFGSCDIMYNGDATEWRKLCNAMQLRVLQTIGKKATPDQKARFAAIVASGNLMTSNDDNFQLTYSDNPNANHPYYQGENRRLLTAVSKLVVEFLKKNNDRRLFYFAEPASALIAAGKTESDFAAYEGAPTDLNAEQLSLNNSLGNYSLLNKRYTLVKAGDPMILFSYAEQCFIIAEAIEEGWVSGSAQTYYENGVKAMLGYYMNLPSATPENLHGMAITQSYIDNYFTGAAAYNTAGTEQDRLEQIITQRWLIDFFQGNSLFSYKTFLRTGFPKFPLDPATSLNPDDKTVYPDRWKYPPDEITVNPINYQKAVNDQYGGYDGINKVPWWLQ